MQLSFVIVYIPFKNMWRLGFYFYSLLHRVGIWLYGNFLLLHIFYFRCLTVLFFFNNLIAGLVY